MLPRCLQVLGVVVVGGAQVDAVVGLGRLDGFLPLVGGLVELVQEVITFASLVQLLCVLLERNTQNPRQPHHAACQSHQALHLGAGYYCWALQCN